MSKAGADLEDSRVCKASGQQPCLAQKPFYQGANVQGKGLVVADQQQGAIQGDASTPLHHPPVLPCGQKHWALQGLQVLQKPADAAML